MKTYNITNKFTKHAGHAISNTIHQHEYWRQGRHPSPLTALDQIVRFAITEGFKEINPPYNIITKDGMIEVRPNLWIDRNYYHYTLDIRVNGKKKDIRTLENIK